MDNKYLKLCVAIFVYNRVDFIEEALKSVISQTLQKKINIDIIIITNCDLSFLSEYVTKYGIRLIQSDGSLGNYIYIALTNTDADIISFLDDDDMFYDNKLEILNIEFQSDPNLVFLHNNYSIYKAGTSYPSRNNLNSPILAEMSNPLSPRIFKKLIKNKIDFNMSCITIRRSAVIWALDYIGKIKAWPDTVLFLIVSQYGGRIKLDNRMLTAYRIHSSNVSNLHDSRTMCVYLSKIKKNYAERIEASNTILDCVNDITLVKFLRERSAVWNSSLLIIEENVEKKEILHWIKQVFLASIRVRTVSVIIIIPLGILLINARFSKLLYYKIISAYFSKLRF